MDKSHTHCVETKKLDIKDSDSSYTKSRKDDYAKQLWESRRDIRVNHGALVMMRRGLLCRSQSQ